MSIGGLMRTSVSGMGAQANRLSAVSDNIANSSTTGYKKQETEFSSLVLASSPGQYNSGMVEAETRTLVSEQGGVTYTTNKGSTKAVDLAIQGAGFFVVSDNQGNKILTRAGAFRNDGQGNLRNAAGYILQGYPLPGNDAGVLNGYAGLQNVTIDDRKMITTPTTAGTLSVTLNKGSDKVPSLVAGTGTTAQAASAVQANAFGISVAPSTATKLNFTVSVDGVDKAVSINKPAGGFETLTANDVIGAINTAAGATIAFVGTSGQIVLKSTTTPTTAVTQSSLKLAGVQFVDSTSAAVSGGSIKGLDALTLTTGKLAVAAQYAGTLPSQNKIDASYTSMKSIVTYDTTGKEVTFDIYMTKTGDNAWEYAVYNRADASTGATAPFPYANPPVTTMPVTFNATGALLSPADGSINFQIPGGELMKLDITGTQQVNGSFQVRDSKVNGNPPQLVQEVSIATDGTIYANFSSGTRIPLFKIPMAQVQSPDNMQQVSGNAFKPSLESGTVLLGFGGESGLGLIQHGALENSTVDMASELTTMIESQRSYTANSKVFQTGSEILDVLVNLKR